MSDLSLGANATADAIADVGALASASVLPHPQQLAALGPLLCLYRAHAGGELGGWAQAVRAAACSDLDSDGLQECLLFFDRDGRCCWRLYLLPDSDFLAWERLASCLPNRGERESATGGGIGERLWHRLAGRLRGADWLGSALRLHALPTSPGFALRAPPLLAASLATLSPLGAGVARRIALAEGADGAALADDCCCRRAAMAASHDAAGNGRDGDEPFPLIRFNLGAQA